MAKQQRDAKATQAKIIYEARILFSKKGFDATTIDDIAKASSVNKALIYYYFKNKSGLYNEVISGLFDAMYSELKEAEKYTSSVTEELEIFIKTYAKYANEHTYFPAILLRELSDSGAHLPEDMFLKMRRVFFLLSDILQRGEDEGLFKKSIPMVIHFMIIGGINLMVTTAPLRKKAKRIDANIRSCPECSSEEIADYIFQTIKQSLEVV